MAKKTCFVVMGFGEKPDYATGRTLDLDKSFRIIIKKAVEEAGLECIRADNVVHSGVIDKPMYELLLNADVVVADLSTSNANAIYELGVRHALRPHTTIVLAEDKFKFPFDLGHVTIQTYQHLGTGIDAEVADEARSQLRKKIEALAATPACDSPVYTFLPALTDWKPTVLAAAAAAAAVAPMAIAAPGPAGARHPADGGLVAARAADDRASTLLDMFRAARAKGKWSMAAEVLGELLERNASDPYLNQQMALATYKSKQPDVETSLLKAREILATLSPDSTTDAETLGLWGAVHKRLWELKKDREALDQAIWALEKGFYVKNDHYNGINLAYLLNARAMVSPLRDAITDSTNAERIRQRVIAVCEKQMSKPLTHEDGNVDHEQMFWVGASMVEALIGTGQATRAAEIQAELARTAPETWMPQSLQEQLDKLKTMLATVPEVAGSR
jgi:tetratricopeptide (TPR) repeat protein